MATSGDVASHIQSANEQFMSAFERRDPAALAGHYTPGAQVLPANSDAVVGRDAIRAFWQQAFAMGVDRLILKTIEVEAHGDTAIELGWYEIRAAGATADHGKYIVVWKEDGGAWKLHRDIWTTSRPAST